jgi:selenide,water dikinase
MAKSGARPGDAVILTKSLGTGTIMAAEMALAHLPNILLGEVVAQAFTSMTRPQGAASAILAPHAHAMTDVTGFGLAGHLMEILEASGVAATLYLSAIPTLPGAIQLVQTHPSSIMPANRAALLGRITGTPGPVTPLLYDPQTGGGLLACVPAALVPGLLAQLRQTDPDAALIGHVTAGTPAITTTA